MYLPVVSLPFIRKSSVFSFSKPQNAYEKIMTNADHHRFETFDIRSALYKSTYYRPEKDQLEDFINNFNRMTGVWRPINSIDYKEGYNLYTVYQLVNENQTDLTHTGPWPMTMGDHVYCMPPFQVLFNFCNQSRPFYYKIMNCEEVFCHPMILNRQYAEQFIRDCIAVKIYKYINGTEVSEDELAKNIELKSEISKKMSEMRMLRQMVNIENPYHLKPIGLITGKQDEYGDSEEVKPGDRFTITWFNN